MSDTSWLDFLLGERPIVGWPAPPMPSAELQGQFVGSAGRDALSEAATFCSRLESASTLFDQDLSAETRLLDFGVGWGRLFRILLNKVHPSNLLGVDIDQKCVDLCREGMPYGEFLRNEQHPPLPVPASHFDVVYAYSVFSHLAEHAFNSWMQEFHRVLKLNGLFVFTTLKESHLDIWRRQLSGEDSWFISYLRNANFDYEEWRRRAARGDFLYVPTGGGDMRDSSFYGEAIITRRHLAAASVKMGFAVRIFDDGGDLPQSFVAIQKVG
jgi:SAM-dependent methyltransferase